MQNEEKPLKKDDETAGNPLCKKKKDLPRARKEIIPIGAGGLDSLWHALCSMI